LSFREVYCEPKPVQPGGVPIWVAGTLNARNLDRVVKFGAAWIPIMGETVEGIADGARVIRDALSTAGRDSSSFQVQAPLRLAMSDDGRPDMARSMESVAALLAAGATDIHVTLRAFARNAPDASGAMKELVRMFHASI
jgi:alkanesulfonate monooxygenase SsuD/methylene tetrahydromethanopterin reductase-like flavin-dependent oxidoreductase (luciferase family)